MADLKNTDKLTTASETLRQAGTTFHSSASTDRSNLTSSHACAGNQAGASAFTAAYTTLANRALTAAALIEPSAANLAVALKATSLLIDRADALSAGTRSPEVGAVPAASAEASSSGSLTGGTGQSHRLWAHATAYVSGQWPDADTMTLRSLARNWSNLSSAASTFKTSVGTAVGTVNESTIPSKAKITAKLSKLQSLAQTLTTDADRLSQALTSYAGCLEGDRQAISGELEGIDLLLGGDYSPKNRAKYASTTQAYYNRIQATLNSFTQDATSVSSHLTSQGGALPTISDVSVAWKTPQQEKFIGWDAVETQFKNAVIKKLERFDYHAGLALKTAGSVKVIEAKTVTKTITVTETQSRLRFQIFGKELKSPAWTRTRIGKPVIIETSERKYQLGSDKKMGSVGKRIWEGLKEGTEKSLGIELFKERENFPYKTKVSEPDIKGPTAKTTDPKTTKGWFREKTTSSTVFTEKTVTNTSRALKGLGAAGSLLTWGVTVNDEYEKQNTEIAQEHPDWSADQVESEAGWVGFARGTAKTAVSVGSSIAAGAAVGAAVGGPVGFVVGIGVGLAINAVFDGPKDGNGKSLNDHVGDVGERILNLFK